MKILEEQQMFLDFRKELDTMCFPVLEKWAERSRKGTMKTMYCNDQKAGFLMVIDGYVEGIYVKPEYRRQGIAEQAVKDYVDNGGLIDRLHIIKGNDPAWKFWHKLFDLIIIDECDVDRLYSVERKRWT